MIVSSHFKEDVSWLNDAKLPYLVVSKGVETPRVGNYVSIPNRGLEFGSYIWYLLNYWDVLPESIAFVHGHRDSYHQQFLIDDSIKRCRSSGFSCLNGEMSAAIHLLGREHPWFGRDFHRMWEFMGLSSIMAPPSVAVIRPSTQTLISGSLLKSLGRSFWEGVFHSLMTHEAHYHLALVMEIAWSLIFGQEDECCPGEFRSFFDYGNISVLMAHPKEAWHSSMSNTVKFSVPESKELWIFRCMEIFQEFAKVS